MAGIRLRAGRADRTRAADPSRGSPASALWPHVLIYAVLLVGVLPALELDTGVTSDEGAYAIQTELAAREDWSYDYAFADLDPDGEFFPFVKARHTEEGWFPYAKHPAYVVVLQGSTMLVGDLGLRLPGIAGALAGAVAAWCLGIELRRRAAPVAFWLMALGPVMIAAHQVWAHAVAAALGGFAALTIIRIVRRGPSVPTVAVLGALLGAGVLIRTEALLFAGAVVVVLGALALLRRSTGIAAAAAGALGGAVVGFVADLIWRMAVSGRGSTPVGSTTGSEGLLAGRFDGALHDLLNGAHRESTGHLLMLGAFVVVVTGALVLRRGGSRARSLAALLFVGAAALYGLRLAMVEADPITGLFPAWPAVLVGLLLIRRPQLDVATSALIAVVVLFMGLVLLGNYAEGGGFEWGGRFFAPVYPSLAVLAAVALVRDPGAGPHLERPRGLAVAVGSLAVFPAVTGLLISEELRRDHLAQIEVATSLDTDVVVSGQAAVPRLAWGTVDDVSWLYLRGDEDLDRLVGMLEVRGVDRATLYGVEIEGRELAGFEATELRPGLHLLDRRAS